jgi:hypothetical protein
MHITITGHSRHVSHQLIQQALEYYAQQLLPRLAPRLTVHVNITNLHRSQGNSGSCTWTDRRWRPRCFEIEIEASIGVDRTLRILAHEMVHVKQFARGEMTDSTDLGMVRFGGRLHRLRDDDGYWTQPWEIEAYGREPGLYHRFKRDHGLFAACA